MKIINPRSGHGPMGNGLVDILIIFVIRHPIATIAIAVGIALLAVFVVWIFSHLRWKE